MDSTNCFRNSYSCKQLWFMKETLFIYYFPLDLYYLGFSLCVDLSIHRTIFGGEGSPYGQQKEGAQFYSVSWVKKARILL